MHEFALGGIQKVFGKERLFNKSVKLKTRTCYAVEGWDVICNLELMSKKILLLGCKVVRPFHI